MVACYLCIDWCIQQHSCGNTIMYYVTIKFSSSGWCAPCCTGVLRTLLFCWRQRLMPLVRMKMGTHHWYTVTSLLIVFFLIVYTIPWLLYLPGKRPIVHWTRGWFWMCMENLALTGCVISSYTDYPGPSKISMAFKLHIVIFVSDSLSQSLFIKMFILSYC